MRDGDELCPLTQQAEKGVVVDLARVADRDDAEARAFLLAEHLPRDNVGVVFHRGDHDLVALSDGRPPKRARHQVNPFRAASREDNLGVIFGAHEGGQRVPRRFVRIRRLLTQKVHTPVDVRVFLLVVRAEPVDHCLRLLRRRGVVEVDERTSVHLLVQCWEVGAGSLSVKAGRRLGSSSHDVSS